VPANGYWQKPKDADMRTVRSPRSNGAVNTSFSSLPSRSASFSKKQVGSTMPNVSPAMRTSVASSGSAAEMRSATCDRISSPAFRPNRSLTGRKRSMSNMPMENGAGSSALLDQLVGLVLHPAQIAEPGHRVGQRFAVFFLVADDRSDRSISFIREQTEAGASIGHFTAPSRCQLRNWLSPLH
jgi:hypothetical protein